MAQRLFSNLKNITVTYILWSSGFALYIEEYLVCEDDLQRSSDDEPLIVVLERQCHVTIQLRCSEDLSTVRP